jgi:hypothetical protein
MSNRSQNFPNSVGQSKNDVSDDQAVELSYLKSAPAENDNQLEAVVMHQSSVDLEAVNLN